MDNPKDSAAERPPRRGRLPAAARAAREREIVDTAEASIIELGASRVTMEQVARRAGASKETLYAWFGDREGLLRAVIERSADESAARIAAAFPTAATASEAEARAALTSYADGFLRLLTSPASIALNRAAMQQPELARTLLSAGRHRIGPLVESYLAALDAAGVLPVPDPPESFELLHGLVVRDTQIRVLLGERPPSGALIRRRAETAVQQFFSLSA